MSDEVMVKLYQPTSNDVYEILKMHNANFKTQQKPAYYSSLIADASNPFWMVVNTQSGELLGYLATRINIQESMITIVAMAESEKITGTLPLLLENTIKDAKKIKARSIITHTRESSTDVRKALIEFGFKESESGKFKDGENKFKYVLNLKGGSKFLLNPNIRKHGQKRTNTKPLPKPVEGEYKIRDAKSKDIGAVTNMHNAFLAKKREESYFRNKIDAKDGSFLVATDSNGSVAGYIACRPERKAGFKGPYTRLNLVSIGVGKQYRGWGIAKGLISKIVERAKKFPNIEFIYGHVRGKNTSAIRLYKKMGFRLKKIGGYKDDKDDKYEFYLRLRLPSIKPYVVKYQDTIKWFTVGVLAHEAIHLVRNYE